MTQATHLVFLVHCDPSMKARYAAALGEIGIVADVVPVISDVGPVDGLSSRYDALAAVCLQLGKGSALRGLSARFKPPKALGDYERVIVCCYSAGYAFARHLTALDVALIDALALDDSGHTSKDPDGTASDAGVVWAVTWARAARACSKVFVVGHTDVDPVTYASTTLFAAETIRLSGPELAELDVDDLEDVGLKRRRRSGLFVVEAWDRRKPAEAKGEHGDALTVWGPWLVTYAAALCLGLPGAAALAAQDAPPDTEPTPETRRKSDAPAGQRSTLTHGYRCSVFEYTKDAKATRSWHPAVDVRAGRYVPKVGDLVVSARAGQEPETGGSGHIEIIIGIGPGKPTTLGGNEHDTWTIDAYDFGQKDFRGVIERDPELGARAVKVALEEHKRGIKETPGPGATKRIQEYHAGARRDGSPLAGMPGHEREGSSPLGEKASDEIPWCGSGQGFCTYQAAMALS